MCRELVSSVIEKAAQVGTFVRIDMEGSPHTERTLAVYRDMRKKYSNVGIVLQAYLYRTEDDVKQLASEGIAHVRLCKGAYKEPASIAFPRKADVDANMVKLMQFMLGDEARAHGAYLAMATHDVKMIEATKKFVAEHNLSKDAFEFQMLYGIRRDSAATACRRRLQAARVRALRERVVSVLYAPPGRASGECLVRAVEFLQAVDRKSEIRGRNWGDS